MKLEKRMESINLKGKHVILGVCGGIAAYKSVELLRLLLKQEAKVKVVMTRNAEWFVGALTFKALSGQVVCRNLFEDEGEGASIRHIDWVRQADIMVIAPATANMLGKIAGGIADDALSTMVLAATCPVMVCPSMNTHMYENRITQRNLDILLENGLDVLEPDAGELACGISGAGRLPEPVYIVDRVCHRLSPKDFAGKRILVTAGPTREAIDPVRFISNHSSGKMGYAVARAAEYRGADVTLVSGPTCLTAPAHMTIIRVQSAHEMAEEVLMRMSEVDIIIKVAAVADYRPQREASRKIKKSSDEMLLKLEKNLDILKTLGQRKTRQVLVGFAAETQDLRANAVKKLAEKNLDLIIGNLVGRPETGFDADANRVTFFHKDGTAEEMPLMAKEAVAHALLDRVIRL
jgi:phosphopantothenoylcysteine decarboxylase/phosphopantothenate--cysteine ligase